MDGRVRSMPARRLARLSTRARRTGQSPLKTRRQTERVAEWASKRASAPGALQVLSACAHQNGKERTRTFATFRRNLVRFHCGHAVDVRLAIEHGSRLHHDEAPAVLAISFHGLGVQARGEQQLVDREGVTVLNGRARCASESEREAIGECSSPAVQGRPRQRALC